MIIPNMWKHMKCSKPPTSFLLFESHSWNPQTLLTISETISSHLKLLNASLEVATGLGTVFSVDENRVWNVLMAMGYICIWMCIYIYTYNHSVYIYIHIQWQTVLKWGKAHTCDLHQGFGLFLVIIFQCPVSTYHVCLQHHVSHA